jgi:hypothetical protein
MNPDYFSDDIAEFIRLLHKFGVRYVIVGGEAVIYYGYPRLTGDVDFFYGGSKENRSALYAALLEFWDGSIPGIQAVSKYRFSHSPPLKSDKHTERDREHSAWECCEV